MTDNIRSIAVHVSGVPGARSRLFKLNYVQALDDFGAKAGAAIARRDVIDTPKHRQLARIGLIRPVAEHENEATSEHMLLHRFASTFPAFRVYHYIDGGAGVATIVTHPDDPLIPHLPEHFQRIIRSAGA